MPLGLIAQTTVACGLSVNPLFCGPSPVNIVVNGDFETGDLVGWVTDCPDVGCTVVNGGGPENFSWKFRRDAITGSPATLRQTLNTRHGLYVAQFTIDEQTIASDPLINRLTVSAGANQQSFPFDPTGFNGYVFFGSNAGPIDLSFTFNVPAGGGQAALDDVEVFLLDDGGAAQGTAFSLAASQLNARGLIDAVFARTLGPAIGGYAWRPLTTQVAGPSGARTSQVSVWGSGFASEADWDDDATALNSRGFRGGVDTDLGGGWTGGLSIQLAGSDGATNTIISRNTSGINSAAAAAYVSYTPATPGFYAQAVFGAGLSSRDFLRTDYFGGIIGDARDIDGWQWFGGAEIGHSFTLGDEIVVAPFLRFDGGAAHEDGFADLTSFHLWVEDGTRESLRSLAGLRAEAPVRWFTAPARLRLHLAWSHEFLEPDDVIWISSPASRPPITLTHPGFQFSEDTLSYGASIDIAAWDQTSFFVSIDGETGDGIDAIAAAVGVRTAW